MADPLSIAASIIAVVDLSATIVSQTYRYVQLCKNAPKDIEEIQDHLSDFGRVLLALQRTAVAGDFSFGGVEKCHLSVRSCEIVMEDISRKLGNPGKMPFWKKRALWPLKKEDVSSLLNTLDRNRGLIQLALEIDQTNTVITVQKEVNDVKKNQEDGETKQSLEKLLNGVNYSSNYEAARGKHHGGTGEWFIQHQAFNKWRSDEGRGEVLWLYGMPGCGKSVLSGTVISTLKEHQLSDNSIGIAYFFFDFNYPEKKSARNMLAAIIVQLCRDRQIIPEMVKSLGRSPTVAALLDALVDLSKEFERVYIVLDALDESERVSVLDTIERLTKLGSAKQKLSILVTSRDELDIRDHLKLLVCSEVGLESTIVDVDIRRFVSERLRSNREYRKWSDALRDYAETELAAKSRGMFRWADLQLDVLARSINDYGVRAALNTLPQTLDETYERMLLAIPDEHKEYAVRALTWVSFSRRPLTLEELAEACILKEGVRYVDPEHRLHDPEHVLRVCGSFVSVQLERRRYPCEKSVQYERVVRLAHYSVKEYFVSDRLRERCGSAFLNRFASMMQNAQQFLTERCVDYLMLDGLDLNGLPTSREGQECRGLFPLIAYAGLFWNHHLHQIPLDSRRRTERSLIYALFNFEDCRRRIDVFNYVHESKASILRPMTHASYLSMEFLVERYLEDGVDSNEMCQYFGTPLIAASLGWYCKGNGNSAVAKLLLEKGAQINAEAYSRHCGRNTSAMLEVARRGNLEVVALFLRAGVKGEYSSTQTG